MQSKVGWLYRPASKGIPWLTLPTREPLRAIPFQKTWPYLGRCLCLLSPALPSPQVWSVQSRARLPRPALDTLLLLMQLKISLVCLAAAPTVDSY